MDVDFPIMGHIPNNETKFFLSDHETLDDKMIHDDKNGIDFDNDKSNVSIDTFQVKMNHNCGSNDYMKMTKFIKDQNNDDMNGHLVKLIDIYW